jgi:hypothetical protein
MHAAIKAGVGLAVVVEILTVIFAATGLHQAGLVPGLILMVLFIALTIGCVFWVLNQTAREAGYGKQLLNAAIVGVVAGVLILIFSVLNLTVFFPDYLDENNAAMIEAFEDMKMPEQMLEARIATLESRTAMGESIKGMIGTLATSVIIGAIIAIFKRKK